MSLREGDTPSPPLIEGDTSNPPRCDDALGDATSAPLREGASCDASTTPRELNAPPTIRREGIAESTTPGRDSACGLRSDAAPATYIAGPTSRVEAPAPTPRRLEEGLNMRDRSEMPGGARDASFPPTCVPSASSSFAT